MHKHTRALAHADNSNHADARSVVVSFAEYLICLPVRLPCHARFASSPSLHHGYFFSLSPMHSLLAWYSGGAHTHTHTHTHCLLPTSTHTSGPSSRVCSGSACARAQRRCDSPAAPGRAVVCVRSACACVCMYAHELFYPFCFPSPPPSSKP